MRGLFITMEGIDGCGKSTQLEMLARVLKARGLYVTLTRQPGGTRIGEQVRDILLANASAGLDATAELLLYAADRAQHVFEVIQPGIAAGRLVISDRYIDSTVAFQGYGRGLSLALIDELNRLATGGLMPDLTILLDLDPQIAESRLEARKGAERGMTRFEDEAREFHSRVREGYRKLAAQHPSRIRVVDASGSIEEAHEKIISLVLPLTQSSGD